MQQKLGILGLSVFCSKVSLDAPPRAQQCHRAGRSQKSYTNTEFLAWMDEWLDFQFLNQFNFLSDNLGGK